MTLLYVEKPKNPQEAIQFFKSEAENVGGCDYGDCMREWNRELIYLRDRMREYETEERSNISEWIFQKLNEMQSYIQFTPNWDVDSTRQRILDDVAQLSEHLKLAASSGRAA